jgi:N,N'-diacetyllegionaminate synthase
MTFIIAEIAQAHDGSLGILHSYIDALKNSGVDAVKFQTHIAEAESSSFEPFRVKFSKQDKTRYDYWKRMEFTPDQWAGIKQHCDDVNLEFISSPFSVAAVDLLEQLNVKRYKIGSGEVGNFLMLEKIATTKKPILLSSGMSSFNELDEAVNFLRPFNNSLGIFQCTTQYPTPPENVGLSVIPVLKSRYAVPVGLSDHSGEIFPSLAAVTLGAELIEAHVVFDKRMFGPDAGSSLTIDQMTELVRGVRFLERAIRNDYDKNDNKKFNELKVIFGKSLAINKDLKKGSAIRIDDLESKKPFGQGISAADYKRVVGRTLLRDLKKWDFITNEDLL